MGKQNKADLLKNKTYNQLDKGNSGIDIDSEDYLNSLSKQKISYSGEYSPSPVRPNAAAAEVATLKDPFNERLGQGVLPGTNIEDVYAENQSGTEQALLGLGKVGLLTPIKAAQGISFIGSALGEGTFGMLDGSFDMENVTENNLVKDLDRLGEVVNEELKVYKPEDWDNRNFLQQLASTAWWADEGADAVAFALSNFIPAGALGKIGLGAKVAGALGKVSVAEDLTTTGTGLYRAGVGAANAMGKMGKSGEIASSILLNKSGLSNPIQLAKNLDALTQTAFMTGSEAFFEAKDTGDTVAREYLAKYNEKAGRDEFNSIESIDDLAKIDPEAYQELKEKKGSAMKNTFWANAAALSFSNYIELGLLNKIFGNVTGQGVKGLVDVGDDIADVAKRIERKGVSKFLFDTKAGNLVRNMPKFAITEGLYEENIQHAIQEVSTQFGAGGKLDYLNEVLNKSIENLSDKEAWKSIGAGMIIGSLFGGVGAIKEFNQQEKKINSALANINRSKENIVNLKNSLYELNEDGTIKLDPETKEPIYNIEALADYAANMNQVQDLAILHDVFKEAGYQDTANLLFNEAFTKYALSHLEAGLSDELFAKIDALSSYKEEDVAALGFNPIDIKDGSKVSLSQKVSDLKERAKQIKEDYDRILTNIDDVQSNNSRINEALKNISRVRELERMSKDLQVRKTNLLSKIQLSEDIEPAVQELNALNRNIKIHKTALTRAVEAKSIKNLDHAKAKYNEKLKKYDELKAAYKDQLEAAGYIVPEGRENIEIEGVNEADERALEDIEQKIEDIKFAKRNLLDKYNRYTDFKNGDVNFKKDIAERQLTKDQENNIADEILAELNEGDFVEFTNKNNQVERGYITEVGNQLTINGNVINANFINSNPSFKKYNEEELEQYKEGQKQEFLKNHIKNAIKIAKDRLEYLTNSIEGRKISILENQLKLEDLVVSLNSGVTRTSEDKLNKKIKGIEDTINTLERANAEDNSKRDEVLFTIDQLEDSLLESQDIQDTHDLIMDYREILNDLEENIKENTTLIGKLKDSLKVLENLWRKMFPDKKRNLQDGNVEYSAKLEEIKLTKQEIKELEKSIKDIEEVKKLVNKKISFLENQIKEYELAVSKLNFTKPLVSEVIESPLNPVASQGGSETFDGNPTPDIAKIGLNKTAGQNARNGILNPSISQQRFFKFVEQFDIFNNPDVKLQAVTINHPIYGLNGMYDLYSEEDERYRTEDNIKVIVIGKDNKPVIFKDGMVYTSILEHRENLSDYQFNGKPAFRNTSTKNFEIKTLNDFKHLREKIKTSKEDVFLKIQGKGNGKQVTGPGISASEAFGTNNIDLEFAIDPVTVIGGSRYELPQGLVFADYNGRPVAAKFRNLTNKEIKAFLVKLKEYAANRGDKSKPTSSSDLELLRSVVPLIQRKDPKFSFFFVKGQDRLVFGDKIISIEELISGQYDNQLEEFLSEMNHNVDRKLLESNKPYRDLFGKQWKSYKDYLLSKREDVPLTFEIAPRSEAINEPQFHNMYLIFGEDANKPKEQLKANVNTTSSSSQIAGAIDYVDMDSLYEEPSTSTTPVENTTMSNVANTLAKFGIEIDSEILDAADSTIDTEVDDMGLSQPSNTDNLNKGDFFMLNTGEAPTSESFEKQEEWFRKNISSTLPFLRIKNLIDGIAFGKFLSSGEVLISDLAAKGTHYHEAFHVVSQLYLTVSERAKLYLQWRKENNNENATDTQVEEALAEEFREYMLTNESSYKSWFKKILDFIRDLLGLSNTNKQLLFEKISDGRFKDSSIINYGNNNLYSIAKDLGAATERDIMENMTVTFMRGLFQQNLTVLDLVNFNTGALNETDAAKVAGIYNQVFSSMVASMQENAVGRSNEDFILNTVIPYINKNKKQIAKDHVKFLNKYGITLREQSENEQLPEHEKVRDSLNIIDSIEFNTKSGMPNVIKLMLASMPRTNMDGSISLNNLGLPHLSDYRRNVAILHNSLAGKSSFIDQIQELKKLTATVPEIAFIFRHLGVTNDGTLSPNVTLDHFHLQSLFRQQFDKAYYEYFIQLQDENNSYLINANQARLSEVIKVKWRNALVSNKEAIEIKNGQYFTNKEYFKQKYSIIPVKPEDIAKQTLQFYKDLGIEFTKPNLLNMKLLSSIQAALVKRIQDTNEASIFDAETKGWMNKLVEEELRTSLDYSDNQHISPTGKTVYNISLNDFIAQTLYSFNKTESTEFGEIKNIFPEHLRWDEETATGNPLMRNSEWAKKIRDGKTLQEIILEGAAIRDNDTDGKSTADLNTPEAAALQFTAILNGKFPMMRASDKSLEKGLTFNEDLNSRSIVEMQDILKGYLADELLRSWLLNVKGVGSEFPVYAKNAKDLTIFKGFLGKKETALYQSIITTETSRQEAIKKIDKFVNNGKVQEALINSFLKNHVEKNKKVLIDNNLVKEHEGEFSLLGISTELANKFVGKENNLSLGQFNELVTQFTINQLISTIEQTKLLSGDLAFYSDPFKRFGGLVATGKTAWTGRDVDQWLTKNRKREYKAKDGTIKIDKKSNGILKTRLYSDPIVVSSYVETYKENLIAEGYSPEYVNSLLAPYESYEEPDGFAFATLTEYREYQIRLGEWTDLSQALYEKVIKGERPSKEELAIGFPVLKPVLFGPQKESELFVPTYYKFSVMPLIPSVVKGTILEDLMYDMLDKGTGLSIFKSGSKVANKQGISLYNENGQFNNSGEVVQSFDYKYIKSQLDISPKVKNKVVFGTQFRKLVLANLANKFITINGVPTEGNQLIKEYSDLINKAIELETEKLINKLGLKEVNGDYILENPQYLRDLLVREATSRSLPSNAIAGIEEVLKDGDVKYFDVLINRNKIEQILVSLVENNLVKQKVFGDLRVQGASTGFELRDGAKGRSLADAEKATWFSKIETVDGETKSLKFYEKGKATSTATKRMEVYLPHYFKEALGTNIDINRLDPRLRNLIGFRTPTQDLSSIEVITIKGFLPAEAGNLVVVPSEIVVKSGSDFDIDKLTLFFPNYKVKYDFNKIKQDFISTIAVRDQAKWLKNLEDIIEKVNNNEELTEDENAIKVYFDEFQKKSKNNYISKFEYIEYKEGTNSIPAIHNRIYELAADIVTAPENFASLISPNSVKLLKDIANELNSIRGVESDEKNLTNTVIWATNIDIRDAFLTGKKLVGVTALHNVHHVISQIAKLRSKPGVPKLTNTIYKELGFEQNNVEEFKGFWNREQVANQSDKIFLFGDNTYDRTITKYIPSVTQAVIRGLSNAIGIDTKKDRGTSTNSYLTDNDFEWFKKHVDEQIQKAKNSEKTIVIPADGIGTGKAMLKEKAPKLFEYLQQELDKLKSGQIAPKEKQQAKQFYSQYLDTIFPDSKVTIHLDHHNINGSIDFSQEKSVNADKNSPSILNILSSFINGSVDIARDPFLRNLNFNNTTAGIYLYLVRAGVPLKQAAMFMNQPIIVDYLTEISKSKALFLTANEESEFEDQIELRIRNKYSKDLQLYDLTDEFSLNAYKDKLSISNLTKEIKAKEKDNSFQQQILTDFLNYKDQAQDLSDLIKATTPDTGSSGSSLNAFHYDLDLIEKLRDNSIFDNVDDLIDETFIGGFRKAFEKAIKMYSPLFYTETEDARKAITDVEYVLSLGNVRDRDKTLNQAKNDLIGFVLQNVSLNNKIKLGQLITPLFHGENSLPKIISKAKQDPLLKDNLIIRELYPIISKQVPGIIKNKESLDNIKTFNKKVDVSDANLITEAWKELSKINPSLSQNLMFFSILQSGLNNSPVSFAQYIPNEDYVPLANNLINKMKLKPDFTHFFDVFVKNNYLNNDLVPKHKRSSRSQFGETVFANGKILKVRKPKIDPRTGKYKYTNKQDYPYLKVWKWLPESTKDKKVGEFELYKNTRNLNEKGEMIFERVERLGDGYNLKELLVGRSVIGSNRIDQINQSTVPSAKKEIVENIEGVKKAQIINMIKATDKENSVKKDLMLRLDAATTNEEISQILIEICQ